MSIQFKVGDKVRLSGQRVGYTAWDWIYKERFKIGTVVGFQGSCSGFRNLPKVLWDDCGSPPYHHYYCPEDLAYLSVIYSEDHLKEKDIL